MTESIFYILVNFRLQDTIIQSTMTLRDIRLYTSDDVILKITFRKRRISIDNLESLNAVNSLFVSFLSTLNNQHHFLHLPNTVIGAWCLHLNSVNMMSTLPYLIIVRYDGDRNEVTVTLHQKCCGDDKEWYLGRLAVQTELKGHSFDWRW